MSAGVAGLPRASRSPRVITDATCVFWLPTWVKRLHRNPRMRAPEEGGASEGATGPACGCCHAGNVPPTRTERGKCMSEKKPQKGNGKRVLYKGLTCCFAFTLSLSMGAGTLLEGYRATIDTNLGTTSEKFVSTSTDD